MSFELVLSLLGLLFGGGSWVAWYRAKNEKPVQVATADNLAVSTQSTIIANLQSENQRLEGLVKELRKEVHAYRREVAEMKGHLDALERFKVNEIAEAVSAKVIKHLVGDDFDQA